MKFSTINKPVYNPNKLPNEVIMAQSLMVTSLKDCRYDLISEDWFEYNQEIGQWKKLNKYQIDQKIFFVLMENPDLTGHLTSDYKFKVKLSLEMLLGVNFEEYRNKNKQLKLIPFKNCVLDLNNKSLLNHSKNYYFTYGLNIDYDPEAKISSEMVKFLCSISNNNRFTLKVLRSFIKCVLLRDNQYQVALYLHGPGGTGKSTFEKLLISLVSNNNSTVLNLEDLNKTFTTSKLLDKSLVLFSDVQSYTGDPSKLRLLISGDIMNAERKYKDSFDLQPDALVVLSSNLLWSPKDSSTGLQRRIIYVPVTTIPEEIDRDLFNFNLITNEFSGTLSKSLPGLVNWALDNPDSNSNLLGNAYETNKYISPNVLSDTNPLVDWIRSYISYEYGNYVAIGRKTSDPKKYLYSNYLSFCKDYGFKELSFQIFSSVIIQQINLLVNSNIQKKRISNGFVITNIKLNDNIIQEDKPMVNDNILDEFDNYN